MLHAIALNCTLERSGQPSSTSLLLSQVGQAMKAHQIGFEEVRIADQKRMPSYGRVATVAVVGNEDGAHHVAAEMFQALNDVGFTLAANAVEAVATTSPLACGGGRLRESATALK